MKKVLNIFITTLLCFYSSCTNPDTDCAKKIKDCAIDKIVNDADFEDCFDSALSEYLNVDSLPDKADFEMILSDDAMSEKMSKLVIALRIESRNLNVPELNPTELEKLKDGLEGISEFLDKISTN